VIGHGNIDMYYTKYKNANEDIVKFNCTSLTFSNRSTDDLEDGARVAHDDAW
jgi:hypothetical protein